MAKADKLLDQVGEHLDSGESVLGWVMGQYEAEILGSDSLRTGIMIATERRVVFYAKKITGFDLESFDYSKISSFEQGKNMMGAVIKFFASGNQATLKWITKGDIDTFTAIIRERIGGGSASASPAASSDDIPGQIRKLAELRDLGVLSSEEFEAKKVELLGRM